MVLVLMVQMPLQHLMRIYLHNMALTDRCRQGTEVVTKAGYMRFTLIGNGADVVITLNEEIG